MRNDILRKLAAELLEPIETERQVVYILCEIRKLMHQDQDKQQWKSLRLYCDWAMHVDLTFESRIRPFMQEVENLLAPLFSPRAGGISEAQNAAIQRLVYLDGFRNELSDFLIQQGLPNELTAEGARWAQFLRQYGGVIHDGSLDYAGSGLQFITKMTFTALPPSIETVPFDIKWNIQTRSGQSFSLHLRPNGTLVGSLLVVH